MKVLHITRTLPQEMLGPMYLSRVVKDAGHDMRAICLPDPAWMSKIKEYAPDVITWSTMTGNQQPIFDLNRLLKRKFDFFSLMGGPHVTSCPTRSRTSPVAPDTKTRGDFVDPLATKSIAPSPSRSPTDASCFPNSA